MDAARDFWYNRPIDGQRTGSAALPKEEQMDQIRRIEEMEARFDRARAALDALRMAEAALEAAGADFAVLEDYMDSGRWLSDYEDDEAGRLPPDLKRGVLSQDGLYQLLAEYREQR